MLTEAVVKTKMANAMTWVRRFFPAKTGIIVIVVEVDKIAKPQISYTSSMPRPIVAQVLKDLLPKLDTDA